MDILKPKTKTRNQKPKYFCWCKWKFDDFFIHFWLGRTRKHFFRRGKKFSCPPFLKSKCWQQNILVFSCSFWFQYIQWIEHRTLLNFHDFWPLLPSRWQFCYYILSVGKFGQLLTPLPPKKCLHLKLMVPNANPWNIYNFFKNNM